MDGSIADTTSFLFSLTPPFPQPFRYNVSDVVIPFASRSRYPKSFLSSFLALADNTPRDPSRTTNLEQLLDDWETLSHPHICVNAI